MPPEWNTRKMVEVPELCVCGLLQLSERPAWLGSAAFSRATLANNSRLSSGERARPPVPRNGLIWACAAEKTTQAANTTDKNRRDRSRIDTPSVLSVSRPANTPDQGHSGSVLIGRSCLIELFLRTKLAIVSRPIRPGRSPPNARHDAEARRRSCCVRHRLRGRSARLPRPPHPTGHLR